MGKEADEALKRVEATRATLEQDLDDLFGRLPQPEVIVQRAKVYGAATAGLALVIAVLTAQARAKKQNAADRTRARVNAEELARAFSTQPSSEDAAASGKGMLAAVIALLAALAALAARASR